MATTYAVNTAGVQALNKLASDITQSVEDIKSKTGSLSSLLGDSQGLGPHAASIESALQSIASAAEKAVDPAAELSNKVRDVAEAYEEIIGNDRFGSLGN